MTLEPIPRRAWVPRALPARLHRAAWMALILLAGCATPPMSMAPPSASNEGAAPAAQGDLSIIVVDPQRNPLAGATVMLSTNASATTDATGAARFDDVPAGSILVTVTLEGYRQATTAATVLADQQVEVLVKLLASQQPAGPSADVRQEQFHLRGYFDCSATYLIITGDCMLVIDTATASAGVGTPAGDATNEEFMLDFPLDHGWQSITGEMHWEAGGPASGQQMTFALEPTEYNGTGHAPKYARSEGGSPLRWLVHAGEPHPSATASADGDQPDMPNAMGGEVVRTRSYVAGQLLHRPAGTAFLGIGAAASQEFEVVVTVFYGERAPDPATTG